MTFLQPRPGRPASGSLFAHPAGAGWRFWTARAGLGALAVATALGASACGADDAPGGAAALVNADTAVVVANSAGTITTNGPQRVMVALLGQGPNDFLGGTDAPATFEFISEDGSVTTEVPGQWLSTAGVNLGLYVTHVTFPTDGVWGVRVKGTDGPQSSFNVASDSTVPEAGDMAPPSQTLTAASADALSEITTDPAPDPSFYQLSVADAVASGQPTVVVFATPAFCQTAVCGPTVDIAKAVKTDHPDVQWVHVEPYDIEAARTGNLVPIEAMAEWNLVTEPWVFVVDAEGKVTASFEGIVGQAELAAAVEAL